MIFFPAVELLDRLAIARVKWRRTQANVEELDYYEHQAQQLNMDSQCDKAMQELETIHDTIWELEKELKSGREQELSLEEIGRRAIAIRDHNNRRIKYKNLLAERVGCPVREIKKDHLSE
jgi:L-lactate utilization protein LutC